MLQKETKNQSIFCQITITRKLGSFLLYQQIRIFFMADKFSDWITIFRTTFLSVIYSRKVNAIELSIWRYKLLYCQRFDILNKKPKKEKEY